MVSGFLTSPWLHARISSAVARPIWICSKKFTSSKVCSLGCCLSQYANRWLGGTEGPGRRARRPGLTSDFFDAARLAPRQVDAQLFGRAEDVLLGVLQRDRSAVLRQHLHVEAEGLHLLDEHLERLRDARVG